MTDTPVIEAQVEEVAEPQSSVAVVPAPPPSRAEVLAPLDLKEVRQAMEQYQLGLRELLTPDDWQGQPNADGSFVKKSGWRKIATWFSLSITLTTDEVGRDEKGYIQRAKVWARATAPNGRAADGDGYCSIDEPRFTNKDTGEPIDRARYKVENDLRATAATRAVNRAISNLVGMGAVSAEEMEGVQQGSVRRGFASPKQQDFFERLLKEAGGSAETVNAIIAYAQVALSGERDGPISKAIDGLKGSDPKATGKRLAEEASAWAAQQSDVPADTEGLEDVPIETQAGDEDRVPF